MGGFKLGRLFGFPIEIRYSFLLLMLVAYVSFGGVTGVLLLLMTFGSVLLHELGHALVARRLGVRIIGIDLHFFGGAAKMASMPSRPRDEILIAAAGPAVSFVLAGLGALLYLPTGVAALGYFAYINLILGGFNLLPALPMDGGRIFRAALERKMGRLRATALAVKVAKVAAGGIFIGSLFAGQLFLAGLAVLLWVMASAELRAAQLWSFAQGGVEPAGWGAADPEVEVLNPDGRPATGTHPISPWYGMASKLTVEEQRGPNTRRWIIRGPDGRILVTTEHPLHW